MLTKFKLLYIILNNYLHGKKRKLLLMQVQLCKKFCRVRHPLTTPRRQHDKTFLQDNLFLIDECNFLKHDHFSSFVTHIILLKRLPSLETKIFLNTGWTSRLGQALKNGHECSGGVALPVCTTDGMFFSAFPILQTCAYVRMLVRVGQLVRWW